ncbi:hypothetical protein PAPHI01_1434 [Pancytospora philotis]|nr:hypothetical protein PAPHI01_1434 [Pancytospora philotis]
MLLATITPRAATVLALFFTIRASTQDGAAGFEGAAITRKSIEQSIFNSLCNLDEIIDSLYAELLKDCLFSQKSDKFHSGIELKPGFSVDYGSYKQRTFIMCYVLACEDPVKKVDSLMSADQTHKRYEVLFDLFYYGGWYETYYDSYFDINNAGSDKSRKNWIDVKPVVLEQLRVKIAKAVSVRTVEHLNGVFTADTVVDALLHMVRKGRCFNSSISYDDLSDLVSAALQSKDRKETIIQFLKPLMNCIVALSFVLPCHVARCVQIVRDCMRDHKQEDARAIMNEIFDWEKLSPRILMDMDNASKFVEIATYMSFDPCAATRYINDFYKSCIFGLFGDILSALSAYYLDALDADGQTRLKKVAENSSLMNGLPHQLILRLIKDCSKLSVKHPEAAKHLKKCLNSAHKSKEE